MGSSNHRTGTFLYPYFIAFLVLSNSALITALTLFTNTTLPPDLSASCSEALLTDLNCSPVLSSLQSGDYYAERVLTLACTDTCTSALTTYENTVLQACGQETWLGYDDSDLPVVMIVDVVKYHYDMVCLKDAGRWCNIVGARRAMQDDPDGEFNDEETLVKALYFW